MQLGYTQPWQHWIFDGTLRYYKQNAANFYSDLFPRANAQNFMARDRELAAFSSYTVGVGATYDFQVPRAPWIQKNTLNLRYDHLMIDYKDFHALYDQPTETTLIPASRDRCVAALPPRRQHHSAFLLAVLLTLMPRVS